MQSELSAPSTDFLLSRGLETVLATSEPWCTFHGAGSCFLAVSFGTLSCCCPASAHLQCFDLRKQVFPKMSQYTAPFLMLFSLSITFEYSKYISTLMFHCSYGFLGMQSSFFFLQTHGVLFLSDPPLHFSRLLANFRRPRTFFFLVVREKMVSDVVLFSYPKNTFNYDLFSQSCLPVALKLIPDLTGAQFCFFGIFVEAL